MVRNTVSPTESFKALRHPSDHQLSAGEGAMPASFIKETGVSFCRSSQSIREGLHEIALR
jgi:hypothetical protein